MTQKTSLYPSHCQLNGVMIDFSGWLMPLHYGSQLAEHRAVRECAGMFDVSHMGIVDITGPDATHFMRYALANDVKKLDKDGKALYSCLLNAQGGIIDDLIVYRLNEEYYRLVINASRRIADIEWLKLLSPMYKVEVQERNDAAIIAVQGPQAITYFTQIVDAATTAEILELKPFTIIRRRGWQIARTGYTGEEGLEIILPVGEASNLWQALLVAGVQPCGLGARDTLRLEAGLNLYGLDMDETTTPLESNLAFTVDWLDSTRDFVGREALVKQKQQGIPRRLVGLVMKEGGMLRSHQPVWSHDQRLGEVTSGSFSPVLNCAIAMARLTAGTETEAMVERRGKMLPVQIVKLPFIKRRAK